MKRVLLTGCAGFIGFHVGKRLLASGYEVLGIDNLNPFYNGGLKEARLAMLHGRPGFQFIRADITDLKVMDEISLQQEFGPIVHLAAQAGVRYSLENPHLYVQSNLVGFVNLIEVARKKQTPHFVYASSSSVYGANRKIPFAEIDNVDHPVSLYAATKKSAELIAHAYAHLYGLPTTGLRFFTVYGPWGRPDMAVFKFCKAIYEGASIDIYNYGKMQRDFTYIDDIVEGIVRIIEKIPDSTGHNGAVTNNSLARYKIYNIGNNQPVELGRLVGILESVIGKKAIIRWLPLQPGDVPTTYADIDRLSSCIGYRPKTPLDVGVARFVEWYREYYKV